MYTQAGVSNNGYLTGTPCSKLTLAQYILGGYVGPPIEHCTNIILNNKIISNDVLSCNKVNLKAFVGLGGTMFALWTR